MKVLFCNVTYMNKYIGITDDDMPNKGGAWVEKNKDAHEQWNFLNYNGYCYGFVMNKGDQFVIEKIDEKAKNSERVDGVTVVWCALNDNDETVIVGWYENATVYRHFQESVVTPFFGIDRVYFAKASASNCYLLPEKSRVYTIGRASRDGIGRGFGQQNFWYAESEYARKELIPDVIKYLETHKHERINRTPENFEAPLNVSDKLSYEEDAEATRLLDNADYYDYLPYGYRSFCYSNSADEAYNIAWALTSLHQYESAIKWYKKVIEIEGDTWDTNSRFPYLYQQCEMYVKSTEAALMLLEYEEANEPNARHELYSIIADNHYHLNEFKEGIKWLDKVIEESNDEDLLQHTRTVKKYWESLI